MAAATPSIGGVGLIIDYKKMVTMDFKEKDNFIHEKGGGASHRSTKWGGHIQRPSPFCGLLSGGGISALRLVLFVDSCAMLAKIDFFLRTKVLCPTADSSVFPRQQIVIFP